MLEICVSSRFTHYITYISLHYKIFFFSRWANNVHSYMLESIPLFTIHAIAFHIIFDVRWGVGTHARKLTLHHTHCYSLQNLLLLKMDKQHSIIHARVHPFFYHTHHCLSQQFWREMGCWNTSKETCALCIFCPNQDRKSKYYILLECSTFNAFDTSFPTSAIRTYPNTHFLLQSQCTLSNRNVYWNRESLPYAIFTVFVPRVIFDLWGW